VTSILILAIFFAQQSAPPEKCTLSGTVVDSVTGLPLGKVEIVAEHVGGNDPGASTTTEARGNFLLVDIDPGRYRLAAKRSGYLDMHYGAKRSSGTGSTLTVTAGQKTENLQIRMTPFGVIAGTVRDSDGEPMTDAHVVLYTASYDAGRRRIRQDFDAATDDLGQFRIANLPSGKYYVSAVPGSRNESPPKVDHSAKSDTQPEARITTFYPGTADPSIARLVEVAVGARVTGVDIALIRSRLYRISAHIDAPKGLDVSAALSYSVDGFGGVGNSRLVDNSGDVEIAGVPPGSYLLRFSVSDPQKPFDGVIIMSGGERCDGSVALSVDHSDVEGLQLAAPGCADVTGHVTIKGAKPSDSAGGFTWVELDPGVGVGNGSVFLRADGTFGIHCAPGRHTLRFTGLPGPRGLYVESIRSGDQDVLRNGFTTSGSEHIELEIVLASDGGRVEGVVSDADDKPVMGATVVLIPSDPALRAWPDFSGEGVTDQSGHFELKNAAPGEYKLFAWDDIEENSWFDPGVLKDYEAKGEPVTVKAKDSQTVKLHVIP